MPDKSTDIVLAKQSNSGGNKKQRHGSWILLELTAQCAVLKKQILDAAEKVLSPQSRQRSGDVLY